MSSPNIACILTVQAAYDQETDLSKAAVQDQNVEEKVEHDTLETVDMYDDMDLYEDAEPLSVFINTSNHASANLGNISTWLPEFDDDLEDSYSDIEPDKEEDQLDQDEGPDPEEKYALYKQYMMHRKH